MLFQPGQRTAHSEHSGTHVKIQTQVGFMKVVVDINKCTGHARCNVAAPAFYELDSDGYNVIRERDVAASDELAAREGALACPERAITIIE